MRAFGLLLVVSLIAFGVWLFLRPDPRLEQAVVPDYVESELPMAEDGEDASETSADTMADSAPAPAEEPEQAEEMMEEEEEPVPTAMTFATNADEVAALFENAPWVSAGNDGPALYVLSFRTCPTCLAFKEGEQDALMDAGVDMRWIIYARRDREGRERSSTEERAVQAELWLTRDWHLFQDWYYSDPDTFYVTTQLPPVAEEDPARAAAVEEARALVDTLADLYAEDGIDLAIPTLLWQQDGVWTTYVGYDEESFAPVRAYLTTAGN